MSVVYLARPEYVYSCGRSSVLWNVSPTAAKGRANVRVVQLAQPKTDHSDETKHMYSEFSAWVYSEEYTKVIPSFTFVSLDGSRSLAVVVPAPSGK